MERDKAVLGTDKSHKKSKTPEEEPAFEALQASMVSSVKCCQKVKYGVGYSDGLPVGGWLVTLTVGERLNGK